MKLGLQRKGGLEKNDHVFEMLWESLGMFESLSSLAKPFTEPLIKARTIKFAFPEVCVLHGGKSSSDFKQALTYSHVAINL